MRSGLILGCTVLAVSLFLSTPASTGTATHFRLSKPDSTIEVQVLRKPNALSKHLLTNWVDDAVNAAAAYYGKSPMRHIVVRVTPVEGSGIGFSTACEEDGYGLVESPVGVQTSPGEFKDDWTLTHEILHLAFPLIDEEHRWLAEGIATYVEPIARNRNGTMDADRVWSDLVKNLPRGLRASRNGLNQAASTDSIYWGGALYCLVADVEIRKRTNGRKGLEDALRAIWTEGGDIASDWSFEDAIKAGDRATGVPVLRELYAQMAEQSPDIDLNALWSDLGIERRNGHIVFNDSAPLSWIRQSITPAPQQSLARVRLDNEFGPQQD